MVEQLENNNSRGNNSRENNSRENNSSIEDYISMLKMLYDYSDVQRLDSDSNMIVCLDRDTLGNYIKTIYKVCNNELVELGTTYFYGSIIENNLVILLTIKHEIIVLDKRTAKEILYKDNMDTVTWYNVCHGKYCIFIGNKLQNDINYNLDNYCSIIVLNNENNTLELDIENGYVINGKVVVTEDTITDNLNSDFKICEVDLNKNKKTVYTLSDGSMMVNSI